MNREKAKYKGKKIELFDIEDNIEEIENNERKNKRLNVFIAMLIVIMVAIIGFITYGVIYTKQAAEEAAIMLDPEIELQDIPEDISVSYKVEDGLVTYTVSGTEDKSFLLCVYEVLTDGQLQCRYPTSILLNSENDHAATHNFPVEKNKKYIIKVLG